MFCVHGRRSLALMICAGTALGLGKVDAAEILDSATLRLTGYVADTCVVRGVPTVNAAGTAGYRAAVAADQAQIAFRFDVANRTDPSRSDIGSISSGQIDVEFDLYCNDYFQFTVESANGGLVRGGDAPTSSAFTGRLDYDVSVRFASGHVSQATATGATMLIDDETVPPQRDKATMTVAFDNPAGARLGAGLYQEALTLSFIQDGATPPSSFRGAAQSAPSG
ncbi:MAG: hypothetical protein AAF674_17640 [Pseudomonadota bacterium]